MTSHTRPDAVAAGGQSASRRTVSQLGCPRPSVVFSRSSDSGTSANVALLVLPTQLKIEPEELQPAGKHSGQRHQRTLVDRITKGQVKSAQVPEHQDHHHQTERRRERPAATSSTPSTHRPQPGDAAAPADDKRLLPVRGNIWTRTPSDLADLLTDTSQVPVDPQKPAPEPRGAVHVLM